MSTRAHSRLELLRAARTSVAVLGLGALPVALTTLGIVGTLHHQYAFDFRAFWQAGADVLHGASPYPAATPAGVASGDVFVYPPFSALLMVPLGALSFMTAAGVMTVLLLAALPAALCVLGVRDWRCYGAALLAFPFEHAVRLGALTPLLALCLALAWRFRDRRRALVPAVAVLVVAKLFLWPLLVWLVATRRFREAVLAAGAAAVLVAGSWAAIGFDGLAAYPRLLSVLSKGEEARGYSIVAAGRALGLSSPAAHLLMLAAGALLLVAALAVGRRRDGDLRAFTVAIAASLALTPIVWMHYFLLLLVPVAIRRPGFSAWWLVPLCFWLTPYEENFGAHWRIAVAGAVAAALVALATGWAPRRQRTALETPAAAA